MIWKHKSIEGLTVTKKTVFKHPTIEGLRLRIRPNGRKSGQWTRFRDKQTMNATLGAFPTHTLADAQAWAADLNLTASQTCEARGWIGRSRDIAASCGRARW